MDISNCNTGYYKDGTVCKHCDTKDNCDICSVAENRCEICDATYYPTGTGCELCTSKGCASDCDRATGVCDKCRKCYLRHKFY